MHFGKGDVEEEGVVIFLLIQPVDDFRTHQLAAERLRATDRFLVAGKTGGIDHAVARTLFGVIQR